MDRCQINATATVCGDRITLECFEGATPQAAAQCELALQQDTEAIYCCTSAVDVDTGDGGQGSGLADGGGGSGAAGVGVGGFGGGGFGGDGT